MGRDTHHLTHAIPKFGKHFKITKTDNRNMKYIYSWTLLRVTEKAHNYVIIIIQLKGK